MELLGRELRIATGNFRALHRPFWLAPGLHCRQRLKRR
jgi:hypothetical protein